MVDPEFWRGRRVFLTGHTGFKGAWLCLWLRHLDAKIIGFSDRIPSKPSLFEVARAADGMTDLRGNINDFSVLSRALSEAAPEIIIHCAAQSLVRPSYIDPIETFRTNILGTAHVLEAARSLPTVRVVLVVTSDKCYENREIHRAYREDDAMGGYDPYSASKGAAEIVTASMRRSFFNPDRYSEHRVAVASARSGNVIGGGDWSVDRLVPDLMRAFAAGTAALIRSPASIRPWQVVLDPLAGYLRLCERLWTDGASFSEGWNFGPDLDSDRSVGEIAQTATRLWGQGANIELATAPQPHEAKMLRLDTEKARSRLGWKPYADFDKAMRLTVDWYRSFNSDGDVRDLCRSQLLEWQRHP